MYFNMGVHLLQLKAPLLLVEQMLNQALKQMQLENCPSVLAKWGDQALTEGISMGIHWYGYVTEEQGVLVLYLK